MQSRCFVDRRLVGREEGQNSLRRLPPALRIDEAPEVCQWVSQTAQRAQRHWQTEWDWELEGVQREQW